MSDSEGGLIVRNLARDQGSVTVRPVVHRLHHGRAMRSLHVWLLLFATACTTNVSAPDNSPRSVRARLAQGDTRLVIAPSETAGTITAARHTSDGWEAGIADLHIETGELVVSAAGTDVTLERLGIALAPIEIPATVIGHGARLTRVRVEATAPVRLTTDWVDDDEGHATGRFDLALSWALLVDGTTLTLGAPDLPPVPVELVVTGDGRVVHGELRVQAPGELWSWANLVRLEDLLLIASAETAY